MKFEIQNPGAIDKKERPWPTAVLETLPTQVVEFVPLIEGADGKPRPNPGRDGFSTAMIGGYETVERPCEVWTIEIASIEQLVQVFIEGDFDITIVRSKVVGCAGLLEFEEPPSYASSYS